MKYAKTRDVTSPNRGTELSAGIDFYVPNDWNWGWERIVRPGERILIPSGIKVNVPAGHALIAFNKSGVATKTGLIIGACVVDEDYQGEIHLSLINTNTDRDVFAEGSYVKLDGNVVIKPGEKLAQFILLPVNYAIPEEINADELYVTTSGRGEGGFGSTNTQ